ncbi:MAG: hypothetical protein R2850_13965 [Bacteroidia bacterium]
MLLRKVCITATCFALFFHTHNTIAQFYPWEVGYVPEMSAPLAKNHVVRDSIVLLNYISGDESYFYSSSIYNAKGLPVRVSLSDAHEATAYDPELYLEVQYNNTGSIQKFLVHSIDSVPVETNYTYDLKNGKIVSKNSDADGRENTYILDAKGHIIQTIGRANYATTDDAGEYTDETEWGVVDSTVFVWNDQNRMILQTVFVEGERYAWTEYTYDANGRLISAADYNMEYDEKDPVTTVMYYYTETGLIDYLSVLDIEGDFTVQYSYVTE